MSTYRNTSGAMYQYGKMQYLLCSQTRTSIASGSQWRRRILLPMTWLTLTLSIAVIPTLTPDTAVVHHYQTSRIHDYTFTCKHQSSRLGPLCMASHMWSHACM